MSSITVHLERSELDCFLAALDWYISDRSECAATSHFDVEDRASHLEAAAKATRLFERLQHIH